ncbi:MAG: dihydropteroate synthase [Bacteroidaceae bacterium]|nr:dihydropteroate synthase [Bacteroidaceae bacterium]
MEYTVNIKGKLLSFDKPVVMGILNVTPDSFYAPSRINTSLVLERAKAMIDAGADILDIGACSTRPGAEYAVESTELERLHSVLDLLDRELPHAVISLDTFRGGVVRECVENHNVAIINDVSGFDWDDDMFSAVVDSRLPYILTHSAECSVGEPLLPQVIKWLAGKVWILRQNGVADVIIDPGFGFGKSVEQNYELMAGLEEFSMLDAPLLVGISRKSMITKLLGLLPADALTGTVALNMYALSKGADILRVHDVSEATQVVKIWQALKGNGGFR